MYRSVLQAQALRRAVDAHYVTANKPSTRDSSAHRVGNVILGKPTSGHLVQQWCEELVGVPVDDGDVHPVGLGQFPRAAQPAEPGTDNHNLAGAHAILTSDRSHSPGYTRTLSASVARKANCSSTRGFT